MDMASILEKIEPGPNRASPAPEAEPVSPWTLAGFGPMTRISTSFGDVHAQAMRQRDMVRASSGDFIAVESVDRIKLDGDFLQGFPDAQPILIRAGALGGGFPKADVVVSPEQKIGIGRHTYEMTLVKARDLLGKPGILRRPEQIFTYTGIKCAKPILARMEGVWVEIDS